jgi:hypothetical protein
MAIAAILWLCIMIFALRSLIIDACKQALKEYGQEKTEQLKKLEKK